MTVQTKYAVRVPVEGRWFYRSAASSLFVQGWDSAQLWNNAKTAEKAASKLRERAGRLKRWDGNRAVPVDTSDAQVVAVRIGEPL